MHQFHFVISLTKKTNKQKQKCRQNIAENYLTTTTKKQAQQVALTDSRLLDDMFGDTLNKNIYLETNGSQMCPCPCLKRNDFHYFFDGQGYNIIR